MAQTQHCLTLGDDQPHNKVKVCNVLKWQKATSFFSSVLVAKVTNVFHGGDDGYSTSLKRSEILQAVHLIERR